MAIPTYTDNLTKSTKDVLNSSVITVISGGNIFSDNHDEEDVGSISIASINKELANMQKTAPEDIIEFLPDDTPTDLPFEHFKNSLHEAAGK